MPRLSAHVVGACLIPLMAVPALAEDCSVLNVFRPGSYVAGQSIAIHPFTIVGWNDKGAASALRAFTTSRLEQELVEGKYFRAVYVASDGVTREADLHLHGTIGGIETGSRWLRAAFAAGRARAHVRGEIKTASGELVADFECFREDSGGLIGLGGLVALAQSGDSRVRKNVEKFASAVAKSFPEIEKLWSKRSAQRSTAPKVLKGESENGPHDWRRAPIEAWTAKDHLNEVRAFVVETDRKDWYQAHVLWLTAPALLSHEQVNGRSAVEQEEDLEDYRELEKGLLPDLEALQTLRHLDAYVLAVTFSNTTDDKGPLFWDNENTKRRTYMADVARPGVRIEPIAMVDLPSMLTQRRFRLNTKKRWRSHPVVFAFPRVMADGSNWLTRSDQVIELHTFADGYAVQARFKLADFQVTDVASLAPMAALAERQFGHQPLVEVVYLDLQAIRNLVPRVKHVKNRRGRRQNSPSGGAR
ncbi:MAG: hypothetical protein AB7I50_25515 [Vicinamibacterales bacterium]